MVVDIPEAYGLILSKDWSTKLNGYFTTDWSHIWLSYNNSQNQVKAMRKPHMKHNVTQLEGKNEPINLSSSVLDNYFLDLELRNYQAEEAIHESNTQSKLLHFSWIDNIDCNIVNLVSNLESNTNPVDSEDRFWFMYFDDSKT